MQEKNHNVLRLSLRDQILNTADLRIEPLDIPEWETTVYVREMSAADFARFMSHSPVEVSDADEPGGQQKVQLRLDAKEMAEVVICCTCDSDGNRVFQDDDIDLVAGKNFRALQAIFATALRLSAVTEKGQAEIQGN